MRHPVITSNQKKINHERHLCSIVEIKVSNVVFLWKVVYYSPIFYGFQDFACGFQHYVSSNICIANISYRRIIGALLSIFKVPLYHTTEI